MPRVPPKPDVDLRPNDEELTSARTVRTDPGAVDRTIPIPASSISASGGRRYEIRKELGRGGEGAVYLAFDRHAEEVIALKILENVSAGSQDLSRLRRELGMARRITHPGIVRLHDLVEIDGRWALAMEYIDGSSLESCIESKVPFGVDAIALLALEMAAALAAAHAAGVTHRDLKPANVLLRADGRPVISDFGISRAHGSRASVARGEEGKGAGPRVTQEGALVGTPLYMSPEQLEGNASAGPVVDVYAFGLILFEVATGQVPHASSSLHTIIQRRTTEDAPKVATLRPDLPPALAVVIDRCLSRDRSDRYADGAAVAVALAPRPLGPSSRGGASLKAPRATWPWVALGAVSVLAALAVVSWRALQTAPLPSSASASDVASTKPAPAPEAFKMHATGHRRVTYDTGCEEFPSFFPDSKRIVFDVTTGDRSHLFVVDIDSGKLEQLTTSPGWDFAAKVSPDGKQIAFLRGDSQLMGGYVMPADGSAPPRLLAAGSIRPSFTRDGKEVWAGSRSRPARVDVATLAVVEEAPLAVNKAAWHVVPLDNGDLAVALPPFLEGSQGGIMVGSGTPGARVWRDLLVDATEEVLALSPDGSHLVSARHRPNGSELIGIPLAGGPVVRLGDSEMSPGKGLAFSADGKRVAWSTCKSFANVVPLADKAGSPPQAWEDLDAARLPDGKLAVVSGRDGTMKPWVIDPSGKTPPRSLDAGAVVSGVATTADGKWVAATTPGGIALVSSEAQQPPRMLTAEAGDTEPSFTLDGRHVLFTRRKSGKGEIFRVALDDGEIVSTRAIGVHPCAVDGGDFLFTEERDGKQQPMLWSAAKAAAQPFSASLPPARYGRPAVSADGKLVAIPHRGTEVIVVNRRTGRVERTLSMGGDQLDRPSFLSDGSVEVTRVRWIGDVWVADLTP